MTLIAFLIGLPMLKSEVAFIAVASISVIGGPPDHASVQACSTGRAAACCQAFTMQSLLVSSGLAPPDAQALDIACTEMCSRPSLVLVSQMLTQLRLTLLLCSTAGLYITYGLVRLPCCTMAAAVAAGSCAAPRP